MPNFMFEYDYMFLDTEFNFKGDNRLVVMILSALTLEHTHQNESILGCLVS